MCGALNEIFKPFISITYKFLRKHFMDNHNTLLLFLSLKIFDLLLGREIRHPANTTKFLP